MNLTHAYLCDGLRTPFGRFRGGLAGVRADDLAALPIRRNPQSTEGLRRGILYIAAGDALVTGDTSALHLGVALRKFVGSWFGLSCWTEIDLYDCGAKFFQPDLSCSPCWQKTCFNLDPASRLPECISRIDLAGIMGALKDFFSRRPR